MDKIDRTYRKWDSMIGRCTRESHPAWRYYGGAGVKVCERWRKYEWFLEDMGEAPEGMWMDRVDNGKGYEPGNCRWVTPSESAKNRRKRPQVEGSMRQLARAAGVPYHRVYQRVKHYGWTLEQALRVPVQKRGGMMRSEKEKEGMV